MDENFTVELISNVKTTRDLERKNSIGNFVSVLSRKLIFNEDWEVALTEISYTKSWYNIFDDQKIWMIDSFNNQYICDQQIEKGNYEIEELIAKINEIFINFTIKNPIFVNCPLLIYNKQTNKIAIRLGESNLPLKTLIFPYFDNFLANLLGLVDRDGKQYPQSENFQFITKFEEIIKYEDTNLGITHQELDPTSHSNLDQKQSVQSVVEPIPSVSTNDNSNHSGKDVSNLGASKSEGEAKITQNQETAENIPKKTNQEKILEENAKQIEPPVVGQTNSQTLTPQNNIPGNIKQAENIEAKPVTIPQTETQKPKIPDSNTMTTTQSITNTQNITTTVQSATLNTSTTTATTRPITSTSTTSSRTSTQMGLSFNTLRNLQKFKNAFQEKKKPVTVKKRMPGFEDSPRMSRRSVPYTRSELDLLKKHFENVHYVEGFNSVTLYGTIKSLFVYCDIIKPNLVGDTEVPLIRRVEIPSNKRFGHQIEIIYTRPEYFPLVSHEINSIEIDIKDDGNRNVDFAFGRVYLKLHFRKKQDARKSLYNLLF